VYAIGEVPKERWDPDLYFDTDRAAPDKVYSRWGGFLDEVPFDPIEFGMPPKSLPSVEPMHLLTLLAVREALQDADLVRRPFDRSRTSVILGASGGLGDLGAAYVLRSGLPLLFGEQGYALARQAGELLPEWTEDSFAGLLLNVAAGRVANRFDFGGLNYIVDAACASSLSALHAAVKELETHNTDIVITGGVDTLQNAFAYLCFSKTSALTPSGVPRTFDESADGIAISEGIVMLVLKRLADAERDGDRIYAVVQGVGGSSDGRALGMTAPRAEGQILALQRASRKAGFSPTTVGLFEAHGTGTAVGDRTEALSLTRFLEEAGAAPKQYAIGSVKSMIGHTKATAGVAGVAKVALALYHKVLPPTLGVKAPNPKARFGDGPLYVNSETRPWLQAGPGRETEPHPRRAGVS
ncbi:MAG: polyketide synthase, partial [Gemmatimonadales bacterium]